VKAEEVLDDISLKASAMLNAGTTPTAVELGEAQMDALKQAKVQTDPLAVTVLVGEGPGFVHPASHTQ
jgi:hypothetical protein